MTRSITSSSRRATGAPRGKARRASWLALATLALLVVAACSSSSTRTSSTDQKGQSGFCAGPSAGSVPRPAASKGTAAGAAPSVNFSPSVRRQGACLEELQDPSNDPAVGKKAPVVTGITTEGKPITLAAAGKPTVIIFLAHWCPHCNREVPALVEQWRQHGRPAGVQLLSVATGSSPNAPNWPPSQWLRDEHWPLPALADTKSYAVGETFGLPGYPYFVFLKPDGTVFARYSGELPISNFDKAVAALRAASGSK